MAKVTPVEERSDRYTKRQLEKMKSAEVDAFVDASVDALKQATEKFYSTGDDAQDLAIYRAKTHELVSKALDDADLDHQIIEISDDKNDTEEPVLAVVYKRTEADHWQAVSIMIKEDLDGSKAFVFTKPMIKTFNMEIRKAGIKKVSVKCALGSSTDLLMDKLVTFDKGGSISAVKRTNSNDASFWLFDYEPLTDAELAVELADDEAKKLDKEAKKAKKAK